jgi:hypothetical protein
VAALVAAIFMAIAGLAAGAQPPTVTFVAPNHGTPAGGTSVTIDGTNFTGVTAVKFGSTNATSFVVNSEKSITATSPAGTGTVDVTVTAEGGTSATSSEDRFSYVPFVLSVGPRNGPAAGATSVTITGEGFTAATAVKFGSNNAASFKVESDTTITAVSPAYTGGSASVYVSVTTPAGTSEPQGSSILPPSYFRYEPVVTSVSPKSGPAGTSVTIEGGAFESKRGPDEFPPFVKAVRFGSTNATSFEVHPSGEEASVNAVAPTGTGTVDVTVETYAGTSLTSTADRYTFAPPPPTLLPCTVTVTQTSARLCAIVNPNGGEVIECKFEYGLTAGPPYEKTAQCATLPGSGTSPVEVSAEVTGLTANTTYHFRVSATNASGTSKGADETFKTLQPGGPTLVTGTATSITQTSATLTATVNPNGGNVSECKFEWGTTTAYSSPPVACASLPGSGTSPVAVSAPIAGLTNKTTYHVRISATNASGTNKGPDHTFTASSTHVYKNGTIGAEGEPVREIAWGTLKFTNASFGEVECKTISAGYLENPTGGGSAIGKVQGHFPYECASESCKAAGGTAIELTPENLPWSSEATEVEGGAFRARTGNRINAAGAVFLRVNCVGVKNTQFFAEDVPRVLNNGISIGSAPDEEQFDQPGSGELESEAGGLKLAGRVKFEGYGGEELIGVKNP